MINRIKEFLDNRPDPIAGNPSTSPYRFWKDTQLSRTTAYRLYNDPSYIPTGDVLEKICSTYRIKPGVILDWFPDDEPQVALTEEEKLEQSKTYKPTKKDSKSNPRIG